MNDWVTDPRALRTLLELGGLQVGDEVILRHDPSWNIPRALEGARAKVIYIPAPRTQGTNVGGTAAHVHITQCSNEYFVCAPDSFPWEIGKQHIVAWRRPE